MQELTGRASLVLSSAFDAMQTSRAYMDGEPLVQRRVFSSEIDNSFVGGFAQPTPTNGRDEHDD